MGLGVRPAVPRVRRRAAVIDYEVTEEGSTIGESHIEQSAFEVGRQVAESPFGALGVELDAGDDLRQQ